MELLESWGGNLSASIPDFEFGVQSATGGGGKKTAVSSHFVSTSSVQRMKAVLSSGGHFSMNKTDVWKLRRILKSAKKNSLSQLGVSWGGGLLRSFSTLAQVTLSDNHRSVLD